jgi:hypothetical protein
MKAVCANGARLDILQYVLRRQTNAKQGKSHRIGISIIIIIIIIIIITCECMLRLLVDSKGVSQLRRRGARGLGDACHTGSHHYFDAQS